MSVTLDAWCHRVLTQESSVIVLGFTFSHKHGSPEAETPRWRNRRRYVHCSITNSHPAARANISPVHFSGAIGGLTLLCLVGFLLLSFRKRGGLKIPKIRKASGPMSLFDSQEVRPDPSMEEATAAVKRPLLYVCGSGSFPF